VELVPPDPFAALLMEFGLVPEALVIGIIGLVLVVAAAVIGSAMAEAISR
jgi:hypothetical protein